MLPVMKIGDLNVTRLIVGSNPFTGKSHLNSEVDVDMRGYFSEEQAFAMLNRCEEAGINAVQSRGSMPVMGLIMGLPVASVIGSSKLLSRTTGRTP